MPHRVAILALVLAAALAAPLVGARGAAASCIASVVVDGRFMPGTGSVAREELPPVGRKRRAVEPACNDAGQEDPDREIRVLTLAGLPADVAVMRRGEARGLYVAESSLVVSAAHPLHRAVFDRAPRRSVRRGGCRRARRAVRGTLREPVDVYVPTLRLRTGSGRMRIRADARTRLTNRPPYETLNPGQRLVVGTSLCGTRRVADTVAFDGATVAPERFETDTGGLPDADVRWLAAAAWVLVILALLLAARRLGRGRSA